MREEPDDRQVAGDPVLLDDFGGPARGMGRALGRAAHHPGHQHHRLRDGLLGLGVPVSGHEAAELAHQRRVHHVVMLGLHPELAMVASELREELHEFGMPGLGRNRFEDMIDDAMEGDPLGGHRHTEQVTQVRVDREHPGVDVGDEPVGVPIDSRPQLMQRMARMCRHIEKITPPSRLVSPPGSRDPH